MKRNIKNSSKRKWIVGGVAFFGAVALLTTGFATWVIGVNQTESGLEVGVTVDSAKNESVNFTANVKENDTLTLAEDTTENNASGPQDNIIKIEDAATPDFTVIVEYTVDIGSSLKATSITFRMTPITATSALSSTEVSSGLEDRGTNYIEFASTHSAEYTYDINPDITSDSETKKGEVTLTFEWGDFFGDTTPTGYYNNLTYTDKVAAASKIEKELLDMKTAFASKINITATVNTEENTTPGE